MLDIFGNVFGRSKKSSSSIQNSSSSSKQEATTTDEDFIVVPNQANGPETSLYPYIDFSELSINGDNPSSSTAVAPNYNLVDHQLTPLDNIPFSSNTNLPSKSFSIDVEPHFNTIDRVDMFLSAPSLSDYNFYLEKSFLREYQ